MWGDRQCAVAVRLVGLSAALFLLPGCEPASPLERSGVTLTPPASWKPVPVQTWAVPGSPLAAWSGPEGASLVVYRQAVPIDRPLTESSAEGLLQGVANRLANLPGLTEVLRRTETWGGQPAGRLELVGPGTGDALAPSGSGTPVAPQGQELIPTRRIVVGVPADPAVFLVWHGPESSSEELQSQVEVIRRGFQFRAIPKPPRRY